MSPLLTDVSEFEYPLMQRETQSKSTIQIRKKSIVESDDKSKMTELLRESIENQNRYNELMIEATKELTKIINKLLLAYDKVVFS